MKELNPWEQLLRSWTPRSPSPRLKQRIFRPDPGAGSRRIRGASLWLAPVTVCGLFMMVTLRQMDLVPPVPGGYAWAAELPAHAAFHTIQNAPPPVVTRSGPARASVAPRQLALSQTNYLMR